MPGPRLAPRVICEQAGSGRLEMLAPALCRMTHERLMRIPEAVVQMQLAANGDAGRAWLAGLPGLISELCERWALTTIGPPFEGGCVAFVAPAVRDDGSRVVLKVSLPDDETRLEAGALAAWNGDGAVRLVQADQELGALLLERLEPGALLSSHPDRSEAISIACSLLRRLWIPAPEQHQFLLVTVLARQWSESFPKSYEDAGAPFERQMLDRAVDVCLQLSDWRGPLTIANRDFHLGNVLAAQREPWLAIDPKPLAGEPAFDTGHLVRSLLPQRLSKAVIQEVVSRLADELGLQERRISEWVFVRSIENAIWAVATGAGDYRWDVACAKASL